MTRIKFINLHFLIGLFLTNLFMSCNKIIDCPECKQCPIPTYDKLPALIIKGLADEYKLGDSIHAKVYFNDSTFLRVLDERHQIWRHYYPNYQ